MSKRASSLAAIQSYLDNPASSNTPAPEDQALPAPHAAPGTQVPAPETKEQVDLDRAKIARERDQLRLEREKSAQKSALEERTDQAAARLQQVVNYSKFRLESVRMPGGLFLPILVLFLFFLALLPINGQTRLQWLWSVVTNNAALSQSEDLTPMPGLGSNLPTTSSTPTMTPAPPGTTPVLPVQLLFTGVEQGE